MKMTCGSFATTMPTIYVTVLYIQKKKKNNVDNEANTITVYMKMTCGGCATTPPQLYVIVL